MATIKESKLNYMLRAWPAGMVAVQEWLSTQNISANLTNWYFKTGWLESIGHGAYKRPGDKVDWQGGLYAIQQHLHKKIHPGAKSALELMGYGHYARLGTQGDFYFFGATSTNLPAWFKNNALWKINVNYFTPSLFNSYDLALIEKNFNDLPIIISSPERAIMEALYLIPKHQSLEESYLLMQGLTSLRPKVVQELLENCRSIKVKRLFMHFAELHDLPCLKYIDTKTINFGKGKRVIANGGVYHKKYQLSLPEIKEEF